MSAVGETPGKRAGSRRGAKPSRSFRPRLLGLSLAVTAAVIAWGYLVYAAIDFGSTARGGDSNAWWFLALAAVGAVACLFMGLMLIVRLLRTLGITNSPTPRPTPRPAPRAKPHATPRPAKKEQPPTTGGHRAAR